MKKKRIPILVFCTYDHTFHHENILTNMKTLLTASVSNCRLVLGGQLGVLVTILQTAHS